jgi:hypothetical protein
MTHLIQLSRANVAQQNARLWEALNEFFAFTELNDLSPAQRAPGLAYDYAGSMGIGGHAHYFSLIPHPEYAEVIAALSAIRAVEQATILSAALDAVHRAGEQVPAQFTNRFAAGVDRADLEQFDQLFAMCKKTIPECLVDYVDSHQGDFIQWRA